MTLDEAIKHAEEVADKKEREKQKWERWLETDSDSRAVAEKVSCELCAEEHRQLAEWLKELKHLRNLVSYSRDFDCTIEKAEKELQIAEEHFNYIESVNEEVDKALEKEPVLEKIKTDIAFAKCSIVPGNSEYLTGFISALSAVERMISQAESEG